MKRMGFLRFLELRAEGPPPAIRRTAEAGIDIGSRFFWPSSAGLDRRAGATGSARLLETRAMPEKSAGLLLYRRAGVAPSAVEVLLVHSGGPFWARKDTAAWSMPKGVLTAGEEPLAAARREFAEETVAAPPDTPPAPLGEFRQGSGKVVVAYAVEA